MDRFTFPIVPPNFLANISHELRTPLAAILGYAELAAETSADAETAHAVAVIRRNGDHLLRLFDDVLEFLRIESGGLRVGRVPRSLRGLVAEVRSLTRASAEQKCLAWSEHWTEPLPEMIDTDASCIKTILRHLTENAVKFTDAGGVSLHIRPAGVEDRSRVEFEVRDTGIGMTPEQRAELFRPFALGDASLSRRHRGLGLGLAISHRLATALGGEIRVQSAPGRGSAFTLSVPADGTNPRLDHALPASQAL